MAYRIHIPIAPIKRHAYRPPRISIPQDSGTIGSWAVGITTARGRDSLGDTLRGLRHAGWTSITVFADHKSTHPPLPDGVRWISREHKLGAWGNRFAGIVQLLAEYPQAENILMCEDDILVAPNTRAYLESVGWPSRDCAVISLYRMGEIKNRCQPEVVNGMQRMIPGKWLWGSCAYVFRRQHISQLLEHAAAYGYTSPNMSDRRICDWVNSDGLSLWVCMPSRIQHRQDVPSSLGRATGGSIRRSDSFLGDPVGMTLITPTRDRLQSFALCEQWISEQDYKGTFQWIVVDDGREHVVCRCGQLHLIREENDPPRHSLCRNIRHAFPWIRGDKILVIEDDDWYSPTYVRRMSAYMEQASLVGERGAKYYHLHPPGWYVHKLHQHASLCRTGFTADVLPAFWSVAQGDHPSIDMRLWRDWHGSSHLIEDLDGTARLCVGIKGMPGTGGRHWKRWSGYNDDPGMDQLLLWTGDRSVVDLYRQYASIYSSIRNQNAPATS